MADPNNKPPLPLHPLVSGDLLYLKWEVINKELNFVSLPSAHHVPNYKSLASFELSKHNLWCVSPYSHELIKVTKSRKPSLGPTQPEKAALKTWLCILICLPNSL